MFKKILIWFFLIIWILIIVVYKQLVYHPRYFNMFWYKRDFEKQISQYYVKYFYERNENPVYVMNDKVFTDYIDDCHRRKDNCIYFPHQQVYADIIWLTSVQYMWSVVDSHEAKYLYNLIDKITNLNPYWDYPYIFWQLLLPWSKYYMEEGQESEFLKTWTDAIKIWDKAMKYNCDVEKLSYLKWLDDKEYMKLYVDAFPLKLEDKNISNKENNWFDANIKLVNNIGWQNKYKNPCDTSEFASSQAFNYFYYLWKYEESSDMYKVASMNDDSVSINNKMVAVIKWRAWNHDKSMQIWFTQYLSLKEKLKDVTNEDEKALYEDKMNKALQKAQMEYHISLIKEVDVEWWENNQCFHKYKCKLANWSMSKKVKEELYSCKNMTSDDIQKLDAGLWFKDLSEDEWSMRNLKCLMLLLWIKDWKVDPNSWELKHPVDIEWEDEDKNDNRIVVYMWDDVSNDWRIWTDYWQDY